MAHVSHQLPEADLCGFFMWYKEHRFNAKEIGYLVSDPHHYSPTTKQLEKALLAFNRDEFLSLGATQINDILTVLNKHILYGRDAISPGTKTYLYNLYVEKEYGISNIESFAEISNRTFQMNGSKSERFAIDLLSTIDGVCYEKNKAWYENDYYSGIPDIIPPGTVKEIKTVYNFSNFVSLHFRKDTKNNQFQIQCYLDLLEVESGEIVYVLVGLNGEERDRYIEYAKEKYRFDGYNDQEIGRKIKKIEKNCDFDHIPYEKRVIRRQYKRNPYDIRLIKKKVTAARAFLAKIDAKFNKSVILADGSAGDQPKNL